ncbi:hypothetical protein HN803_00800 [candidate division WWE3 bacterium]|jgi:hypothetical protein|nr:hypothetical protein [candidate division WWE3 bacterium]MBT7349320.1 hypothetical protein [candidate division WWE3 bacterium]
MKKILMWVGGIVIVLILIGMVSSGSDKVSVPDNSGTKEVKVNKADLLASNDPTLRKIAFATADYVGEEFDVYAMLDVSDYYNYEFNNEEKYYSFSLVDTSMKDSWESSYAFIDKTDESLRASELFDKALEGEILVKLHLSIPVEKYTEGSNAYFEIMSWEIVE